MFKPLTHYTSTHVCIILIPKNYYKIFNKNYYKMTITFFPNEYVGESSIFSNNVLITGPNIKYLHLNSGPYTMFKQKIRTTVQMSPHINISPNIETFIISVPEYKFKLHKKITCLKIENTNQIPNLTNKLKCLEITSGTVQLTKIIFILPNKLTHFRFESCTICCFNFPKTLCGLVLNYYSNYTYVLIFPKSLK